MKKKKSVNGRLEELEKRIDMMEELSAYLETRIENLEQDKPEVDDTVHPNACDCGGYVSVPRNLGEYEECVHCGLKKNPIEPPTQELRVRIANEIWIEFGASDEDRERAVTVTDKILDVVKGI